MHPEFARCIATQRHIELIARAESRRRFHLLRQSRSTGPATIDDAIHATLAIGRTRLDIRPIDAADGERLERLVARMSPTSRRLRFWGAVNRLSPATVEHLVNVDHDSREALVAVQADEIVAVARYDGTCATREADVALTVDDGWQRRGLGRELALRLARVAHHRDFELLTARVLPQNRAALSLARAVAPAAAVTWESGAFRLDIPLVRAG